MTHYYQFPECIKAFDRERPEQATGENWDAYCIRLRFWEVSGVTVECEISESRKIFDKQYYTYRDLELPIGDFTSDLISGINVTPYVTVENGKAVFKEPGKPAKYHTSETLQDFFGEDKTHRFALSLFGNYCLLNAVKFKSSNHVEEVISHFLNSDYYKDTIKTTQP